MSLRDSAGPFQRRSRVRSVTHCGRQHPESTRGAQTGGGCAWGCEVCDSSDQGARVGVRRLTHFQRLQFNPWMAQTSVQVVCESCDLNKDGVFFALWSYIKRWHVYPADTSMDVGSTRCKHPENEQTQSVYAAGSKATLAIADAFSGTRCLNGLARTHLGFPTPRFFFWSFPAVFSPLFLPHRPYFRFCPDS